jgi:hypothetical protein
VGALWTGLARTLGELDALAADPPNLADDDLDALRSLQYRLHCASEDAFALAPPAAIERAHTELATALADARDATADVAEALEEGGADAAIPCVYEWRGALFRVRLARMRFTPPKPPAEQVEPLPRSIRRPLAALLFVAIGAALFADGAVDNAWPLWTAGIVAVCASFFAYRP